MPPPTDVPGVTLTPSSLGGFQVEKGGKRAGWIHRNGDRWNAYLPANGATGDPVGTYPTQDDAIRAIVTGDYGRRISR